MYMPIRLTSKRSVIPKKAGEVGNKGPPPAPPPKGDIKLPQPPPEGDMEDMYAIPKTRITAKASIDCCAIFNKSFLRCAV